MTYSNITLFRCSCCGKELHGSNKDLAERTNGECAQCQYLHALGIYTIEQYNEWLRKP